MSFDISIQEIIDQLKQEDEAQAEQERLERLSQQEAQRVQRLTELKSNLATAETKQHTQGLAERIYLKRQIMELERAK